MPARRPRFWFEILILGLLLVYGTASLQLWIPHPWTFVARVIYAAALFVSYGAYYDRVWK